MIKHHDYSETKNFTKNLLKELLKQKVPRKKPNLYWYDFFHSIDKML